MSAFVSSLWRGADSDSDSDSGPDIRTPSSHGEEEAHVQREGRAAIAQAIAEAAAEVAANAQVEAEAEAEEARNPSSSSLSSLDPELKSGLEAEFGQGANLYSGIDSDSDADRDPTSSDADVDSGIEVAEARKHSSQRYRTSSVSAPVPPAASPDPDVYPYAFWPPLPWDHKEHNAYEGKNQFAQRQETWEQERIQARRAWLASISVEELQSAVTWRGVRFLGEGAYGSCGLWVGVDGDDNIVDRVAAKESAPASDSWYLPSEWRKRLPREVTNHRLLDRVRNENGGGVAYRSIIRHRGHRLLMRQRRYRLYLDLCTQGDLARVTLSRFKRFASYNGTHPPRLPERFLWHVFAELVDAALILRRGRVEGDEVEGWRPMVHGDIMAFNVFLDDKKPEDGDVFDATWPRLVLADFGRTFYELNTDPNAPFHERDNPREYRLTSDDSRYPPEIQHSAPNDIKITEKTDVWSIGAIMYGLASHDWNTLGPVLSNGQPASLQPCNPADIMQGVPYPVQLRYPASFRTLVTTCLAHDPNARPDLATLKTSIAAERANADVRILTRNAGLGLSNSHDFSVLEVGQKHRQRRG